MIDASATSLQPTMVFEHRIVEMPQRRVGGHAVDAHIEPAALQLIRKRAGPPLREVAAIRDAADDRVAPFLGLPPKTRAPPPRSIPHRAARHPRSCDNCRCPAAPVRRRQIPGSATTASSSGARRAGSPGLAITREIGWRLDIKLSWPCALSHDSSTRRPLRRPTRGAASADPRSDAATIHACKCIWSAARFETPCSACR